MNVEYTDVKKFIVSIGVILIFASVLVPWLILREPFEFNFEADKLTGLTDLGRELVLVRQSTGIFLIRYWPIFTVALFLIGGIMIGFGLKEWWKMQSILDRRERAVTGQEEEKLRKMTEEDLAKTRKEDAAHDQVIGEGFPAPIEKYGEQIIGIEEQVLRLLHNCIPDDAAEVLTNRKIDNAFYDIIVKFKHPLMEDLIIEIKYAERGYRSGWVTETANRVLVSLDLYNIRMKRTPRAVIVFVSQELPERFESYQHIILSDDRFVRGNVHVAFLRLRDIRQMTCEKFIKIIFPRGDYFLNK